MKQQRYAGYYKVVFAHLVKVRGMTQAQAHEFIAAKSKAFILRLNNFIARRHVIAHHDFCVMRGGTVQVCSIARGSSFVTL